MSATPPQDPLTMSVGDETCYREQATGSTRLDPGSACIAVRAAWREIDALRAELSTARAELDEHATWSDCATCGKVPVGSKEYRASCYECISTARGRIAEVEKAAYLKGATDHATRVQEAVGDVDMQAEGKRYGVPWGGFVYAAIPGMVRERDAALAQVTALRREMQVALNYADLEQSQSAAVVLHAALAPAVTATPSEDVISHHATWEDGEFEPPSWVALRNLVAMLHEHESRGEAADFFLNEGCPDCTHGTVPDRSNKGRCPYHSAVELLRETEGK